MFPVTADVCSTQDTTEAGDACRAAELAKDSTGDYSKISVGTKSKYIRWDPTAVTTIRLFDS